MHRSHRKKIFLKRRPHHSRSHLRTQRQRTPSRIRQKRKHLLSNNIRRRPDASLKKLCILKNRRTYLTEPEQGCHRVHNSFNIFPPDTLFRKNIPRALNCLILRHTIKILYVTNYIWVKSFSPSLKSSITSAGEADRSRR